jgi:hypothetical protein
MFNVVFGKCRLFGRKAQSMLKSLCREGDFFAKSLQQFWHADVTLHVRPQEGGVWVFVFVFFLQCWDGTQSLYTTELHLPANNEYFLKKES